MKFWIKVVGLALVTGTLSAGAALPALAAPLRVPDKAQNASLITAVKKNDLPAVRAALEKGAEPEARDDVGDTALVLAARAGREPIVHALIEKGAKRVTHSWYGKVPIVEAAAGGYLDVVRLLAYSPKEANAADREGRTALHAAAEAGNLEVARALLALGADPNLRAVTGATPLHLAAGKGRTEMARFLLEQPSKVKLKERLDARDRLNRTPLFYAAVDGYVETARFLLEQGTDVKIRALDGNNAFIEATVGIANHPRNVLTERAPLLTMLLDKGLKVDSKDERGTTALMNAAEQGKTALIRFLLEHGADPSLRDRAGYSAYDYAVRKEKDEAAALLKAQAAGAP